MLGYLQNRLFNLHSCVSNLTFYGICPDPGTDPHEWAQAQRDYLNDEFRKFISEIEEVKPWPFSGNKAVFLNQLSRTRSKCLRLVTMLTSPHRWGRDRSEWTKDDRREMREVQNFLNQLGTFDDEIELSIAKLHDTGDEPAPTIHASTSPPTMPSDPPTTSQVKAQFRQWLASFGNDLVEEHSKLHIAIFNMLKNPEAFRLAVLEMGLAEVAQQKAESIRQKYQGRPSMPDKAARKLAVYDFIRTGDKFPPKLWQFADDDFMGVFLPVWRARVSTEPVQAIHAELQRLGLSVEQVGQGITGLKRRWLEAVHRLEQQADETEDTDQGELTDELQTPKAIQPQTATTPPAIGEKAEKPPRTRRAGRKPTDERLDRQIREAWDTGKHDVASLAKELGLKSAQVQKSLDRSRKRLKRRNNADK
jgi:hypothetical protein